MKTTVLALFISMVSYLNIYGQNSNKPDYLQNDLRYWFPIGVKEEVLKLTLNEANINYSISAKDVTVKSPKSEMIKVDKIITVSLNKSPKESVPGVIYMMFEGTCCGMLYLDSFENLSKWKDILQNSERIEDNLFLSRNMVYLYFTIEPKESILRIQIDVTY